MYFTKNNGEPMTAQERRDRYPDGQCALCGSTDGYSSGVNVDEADDEDNEYFIQCQNCGTIYPEDQQFLTGT